MDRGTYRGRGPEGPSGRPPKRQRGEEAFWGDEEAEDMKPILNPDGTIRSRHDGPRGRYGDHMAPHGRDGPPGRSGDHVAPHGRDGPPGRSGDHMAPHGRDGPLGRSGDHMAPHGRDGPPGRSGDHMAPRGSSREQNIPRGRSREHDFPPSRGEHHSGTMATPGRSGDHLRPREVAGPRQNGTTSGQLAREPGQGEGPHPAKRSRTAGEERMDVEEKMVRDAQQIVEERRAEVERLETQLEDAKAQLAKAERMLHRLTADHFPPPPPPPPPASSSTPNPTPPRAEKRPAVESTNGRPPFVIPNGLAMGEGPSHKRVKVEERAPGGGLGREGGPLRGLPAGKDQSGAREGMRPPPVRAKPLAASVDVIPLIRSQSQPAAPRLSQAVYIISQHKRKMRTLVLNPDNPTQCVTSALDGYVNFWGLQGRGRDMELRFSTDCMTKGRKWPESVAWHASGGQLAVTFSADPSDPNEAQVALLHNGNKEPFFLSERPHDKGVINDVAYMPWDDPVQFVTGGSDHLVALWTQRDEGKIEVKKLHKLLHSSSVSSVAGLPNRRVVVSAGMDKRLVAWDVRSDRCVFQHMLDNKALAVLPNTADHNLLLVQTGTPAQQLRLFDYRAPKIQLHAFGWEQKSSETQSALITPSWSPDGLFVAAGSADPIINLFDIRYNSKQPAARVQAHTKRIFKAAWHHTYPLIVSISSDLNIGLHPVK